MAIIEGANRDLKRIIIEGDSAQAILAIKNPKAATNWMMQTTTRDIHHLLHGFDQWTAKKSSSISESQCAQLGTMGSL